MCEINERNIEDKENEVEQTEKDIEEKEQKKESLEKIISKLEGDSELVKGIEREKENLEKSITELSEKRRRDIAEAEGFREQLEAGLLEHAEKAESIEELKELGFNTTEQEAILRVRADKFAYAVQRFNVLAKMLDIPPMDDDPQDPNVKKKVLTRRR